MATARDIMTKRVATVSPRTSIGELTALLAKRKISGVPVVEGGKVVGIVTEADVLARRKGAKQAGQIMTKRVVSVSPDASVEQVASILAKRKIKRVPVIEGGKLVGIVSRADIVKAMASR